MVAYTKKWLSLDAQVARLAAKGLQFEEARECAQVLRAIGYYRFSGYLYPFRRSEWDFDGDRTVRVRVLDEVRDGVTLADVVDVIEFDRGLRALVLDGVERIEVALRMQLGYVLGRSSGTAHLEEAAFTDQFCDRTEIRDDGLPAESKHQRWQQKVSRHAAASGEPFVAHFREKYDDELPIWILTEVMEFGHISSVYPGLRNDLATEIAQHFGVPTKKIMNSWIASLNYVRNVAAHQGRLFNRKLVVAPKRPSSAAVPLLGHLHDVETAKRTFGVYNMLAVIAYLLRSIEPNGDWNRRVSAYMGRFPTSSSLTIESLGAPINWSQLQLWE
ncbi:Abi family protein [Mycetocola sp. JXN-3]|uniref:Abi family protein n=1 Tax=Mycetocola sp. JXN-3 TaxID=2116510 RepID=UPI00165D2595|nr:Abi family protein [Mycetocola sp. JXN-3]